MSSVHKEVQKQIHQDWANREYIELITASIKRITDFLNSFGKKPLEFLFLIAFLYIWNLLPDMSCRSRLAVLNEKLTTLERRIDYLEATVSQGETLA